MLPYQNLKRIDGRLTAGVFAGAPSLAVLGAVWPVDSTTLAMACIVLALATLTVLPFVGSLRLLMSGVAALAIILSVMTSNWPLRAAFELNHASFDRIAARILDGNAPQLPCRVGIFRIERAELFPNGVVCLWTDIHPNGFTGFVQCRCDDLPLNLWSHTRLSGTWHFIKED